MDEYAIHDLKSRFDLRRYIEKDLGPPNQTGSSYVWPCPFHNERTPGGFRVFKDGYKCFSCGAQGDIIDWRMERTGETFQQATAALNGGQALAPPDPVLTARRAAERAKQIELELQEKIEQAQKALKELRKARSWLEYHSNLQGDYGWARELWKERGIDDFFIDYWQLGYCEDYTLWRKDGPNWIDWWHSPTLSIPVWSEGWEISNVKHRLINAPDTGGKYIQEKRGIPAAPFIANPDLRHGPLLLVEGEIKSMVSFMTLNDPDWQAAGLPGVTPDPAIYEIFANYEPVYLCLDPDAYQGTKPTIKNAIDAIGKDRTRVMWLPQKIDDAILAGALTKNGLYRLINSARKPT